MITVGEAVESAKVFVKDSGFLTQSFYNQLLDSLKDEDRHAFTISLADLGIQAKWARKDVSVSRIAGFLANRLRSKKKVNKVSRLKKVMQRMVESPGGLWMPSTMEEEPPPEEEYVSFMPEMETAPEEEYQLTEEDIQESWTLEEYEQLAEIEEAKEILEEAGIAITPDGKIDFYKSQIPGIYTEKGRMKGVPIDNMVKEYERRLNMMTKQQGEIDKLQDSLSGLDANYNNLLGINYRSFSSIPEVAAIGEELEATIGALEPTIERVEEIHGTIDTHYQTLYDNKEYYEDLLNALLVAKNYQQENPELFKEFTGGMGGLAAMLRPSVITKAALKRIFRGVVRDRKLKEI